MTFDPLVNKYHLVCRPSRTQVMEELKRLVKYYKQELGGAPELLGLALSARKNLCIHPEVCVVLIAIPLFYASCVPKLIIAKVIVHEAGLLTLHILLQVSCFPGSYQFVVSCFRSAKVRTVKQ